MNSWFSDADRIRRTGGRTSAEIIGDRLKSGILDALRRGNLSPGDFLTTESALVDQFNVSRVPVRDALRELQALGLVEIRVGKSGGIFVAQDNIHGLAKALSCQIHLAGSSAEQALEALGQIQGAVIELAAAKADASDISRLDALLQELHELAEDSNQFSSASIGFLEEIINIAENPVLAIQVRTLIQFLRDHHLSYENTLAGPTIVSGHQQLIEHLRNNDGAAARQHFFEYTGLVSNPPLKQTGLGFA